MALNLDHMSEPEILTHGKSPLNVINRFLETVTFSETTTNVEQTNITLGSSIETRIKFLRRISGHKNIVELLNKDPHPF